MARLSYGAPGVYVEQIPSARQPIAGVGTNTVAFIGLVLDKIYYPVPYKGYDPVVARAFLEVQSVEADRADVARKELDARLTSLVAELPKLNDALDKAKEEVKTKKTELDAATAKRDALPADDAGRKAADIEVRAAGGKHTEAVAKQTEAQRLVDQNNADTQSIKPRLSAQPGQAAAPSSAQPGQAAAPPSAQPGQAAPPAARSSEVEVEDPFEDGELPQDLLQPLMIRPYYLKEFKLEVEPLATKLCTNFTEYANRFGEFSAFSDAPAGSRSKPLYPGHHYLTHAVKGFFDNGGTRAFVVRISREADLDKALERIESIDEVSILAAPGLTKSDPIWEQLQTYCENDAHQNVFAILDSPAIVNDGSSNDLDVQKLTFDNANNKLPRMSSYAAFYFPHIQVNDPAKRLQDDDPARGVPAKYRGLTYVAPSGHIAGVYARTDEERGVHKAPANTVVRGALEVKYYVSRPKQELLNPQGVNCIRIMNGTVVVWGARTLGGDRNGEWKYVNVRRFAGFLEESIDEGTQWVVFEPNDPALWSKIRLNVSAFLTTVWRNGALFGLTPEEAFYVKCDEELNPPEVRDLGQVITEIGVAIVRPAEFVIFRIAQFSGAQRG